MCLCICGQHVLTFSCVCGLHVEECFVSEFRTKMGTQWRSEFFIFTSGVQKTFDNLFLIRYFWRCFSFLIKIKSTQQAQMNNINNPVHIRITIWDWTWEEDEQTTIDKIHIIIMSFHLQDSWILWARDRITSRFNVSPRPDKIFVGWSWIQPVASVLWSPVLLLCKQFLQASVLNIINHNK